MIMTKIWKRRKMDSVSEMRQDTLMIYDAEGKIKIKKTAVFWSYNTRALIALL